MDISVPVRNPGDICSYALPGCSGQRMVEVAKMVKRTSGLKDEETCATCTEMLDDLHALMTSDEANDIIDYAKAPLVCITRYPKTFKRSVFSKVCDILQLILNLSDDDMDQCPDQISWDLKDIVKNLAWDVKRLNDDICSFLFTDCPGPFCHGDCD